MILDPINLYFNLDARDSSLVESKEFTTSVTPYFNEGDTYKVRIHLRKNYVDNVSEAHQLDDKHSLILASAVVSNSAETDYISYQDKFELVLDEDGDACYEGVISFATQSAIDLLSNSTSQEITLELVVVDKLFGNQYTLQGSCTVNASLVKGAIKELNQTSINIGSYSSVVSLATGIVDSRILDLKAGAPVEFDTLYELAEYTQKIRDIEVKLGDYYSYLDGKKLADQNLTVVSLGNLAIDTSTYVVSHEPWRPIKVEVALV